MRSRCTRANNYFCKQKDYIYHPNYLIILMGSVSLTLAPACIFCSTKQLLSNAILRPYQWILQFWNSMDKMDQVKWSGTFCTCKKSMQNLKTLFLSLSLGHRRLFVCFPRSTKFEVSFSSPEFVVLWEIIYKTYIWFLEVPFNSNNFVILKNAFPKNDLWHSYSQDLGVFLALRHSGKAVGFITGTVFSVTFPEHVKWIWK